ncbi:phosphohistidine phosphatase SixA [Gallibacterium genomosp. 1]|uniref:Phosphohistidine phosphatase n=1 Tax=Gallibacterium genomosp. 1 TaxID=155515 RepID=A0A0A2Y4H4_9PAST|nr:phosphohistidine phosphatase SixA [Gallibacterium genomosp. 1]KGQ39588.1 phosphohistidine phosphatase [Gallibacterium genomosp. 1]
MHIFIMRHGEASFYATSDKERPLTTRGEEQAKQQGKWLLQQGWMPDFMLVSPYLRAQQTHKQICSALKIIEHSECWDNLTPYGNAYVVADYLDMLAKDGIKNVLIISHLPLVDEIVQALGITQPIAFHTATLVEIAYNNGKGVLLQIKQPDI